MKKITKGIWKTVQWVIAIFLAIATLGAFMDNFGAGICWLAATLLICPLSRDAIVKLLNKKKGLLVNQNLLKKNKGEIHSFLFGALAIVFLCIGSGALSEGEDANSNQVIESTEESSSEDAEHSSESVENIQQTEEPESLESTVESSDTIESTDENSDAPSEADSNKTVSTESSESNEDMVVSSESSSEPIIEEPMTSDMEVHFIDVGQGDATLVKADSHYMLIDAGDNSKGSTVQLYLQKQGVEKLDYLVLTHTDADHIGGADVIVSKFDIDNIFIGDFKKDNKTYEELMDAIEYKYMDYSIPEVGSEYQLGNATFTILAPNAIYDDPNNSSIALVLRNGENSFLFSGDCESDAEADIVSNGLNIDVDVYKVGHHGSSTSSTKVFLDAMTPTYGVISCEEGNGYGHPHAETLNNLRAMGVKVFRTDEQGSIVAYSDGTEITWNCAPSDSWKAGEATQNSTAAESSVANSSSSTVNGVTSESISSNSGTGNSSSNVEQPSSEDTSTGAYAVNAKNGKIHIVGDCSATGTGKNAMKNPVYFNTFEEAEAYSIQIAPGEDKRKCGNCW